MQFVETSIFTRLVDEHMSDDQYHLVQIMLSIDPRAGRLIQNSGGLRKVRWGFETGGKRSGLRLIYLLDQTESTIYLIYLYKKSETSDLSKNQIAQLKNLVKALRK